jgi:ADP-ribosylglycohydrolase
MGSSFRDTPRGIPVTPDLDRFRGCILGLAIGDALGHPTEFVSDIHSIRARWGPRGIIGFVAAPGHPAGTFTDDTQMTIAVSRALVRSGHAGLEAFMATLADELLAWARSPDNDRAPGFSCMAGCHALRAGSPWRSAGVSDSKGCGAAMRAAPFGLYFSARSDQLVRFAAAQSAPTHRHPTAIASSVAVAAAVAYVAAGHPIEGVVEAARIGVQRIDRALFDDVGCDAELTRSVGTGEMLAALARVERCASQEADDVCALLGGGWVGEEAVGAALWCVLRAGGEFRQSVLRGANSGGDSDSIASIAGAIAGAAGGSSAIDPAWLRTVEKADLLERLAVALLESRNGGDRPRTTPDLDPFGAERS